jgi:hypothetical protein
MFSRTIRSLSKLQTLNLTVVKIPGDESMVDGAVRIARSNPGLREFSIRYIPRNYYDQPAPYPPRTTDRLKSIFEFQNHLEIGKFELTCDSHGHPVTLHGREWKEKLKLNGWTSWASSLISLPVELASRVSSSVRSLSGLKGVNGFTKLVKRYERDMRPSGHPGVRKLGFTELIVDGGAAGRDLRMLVFSMALVVISTGAMLTR